MADNHQSPGMGRGRKSGPVTRSQTKVQNQSASQSGDQRPATPVARPRSDIVSQVAGPSGNPFTPPVPKPRTSLAGSVKSMGTKEKELQVAKQKASSQETVLNASAVVEVAKAELSSCNRKLELYNQWKADDNLDDQMTWEFRQLQMESLRKEEALSKAEVELQRIIDIAELQKPIMEKEEELELEELERQCYGFGSDDGNDHNGRTEEWLRQQQQTLEPPAPQSDIALLASSIRDAITASQPLPTAHQFQLSADKDLPSFTGKPEDWPLFLNEFERTSKVYKLQNSENMVRLRKALKSTARETVYHLLSEPSNVPEVMDTLKLRFGQPKFVLDALVKRAKASATPNTAKPETIIEFGLSVQALVTNINSYNQTSYLFSVDLLDALVKKLPPDLNREWYRWLDEHPERSEELQHFNEWITREVRLAYKRSEPCVKEEEVRRERRNRHVGATPAREIGQEKPKKPDYCLSCKVEGHHLRDCAKFPEFPLADRMKFVKLKNLCFCCLRTGHMTPECRSKKKCGVSGCSRNHHPHLHDPDKSSRPSSPPPDKDYPQNNANIGNLNQSGGEELLWYVPVKIRGPKGVKSCYAMIDNGAQLSLLDQDVATELGLNGSKEKLYIGVFNGKESQQDTMKIQLEIAGDYANAKYHEVRNVYTTKDLNLPAQTYDVEKICEKHRCLKSAPLRSQNNVKPSMIIGNDNWRLGFPKEKVESSPNSPAAIKTKLGWLLIGGRGKSVLSRKGFFHLTGSKHSPQLEDVVKDFICLDNFGVSDTPSKRSKEDLKSLAIMESTTKRIGDRWETGLLWRDPSVEIPDSKEEALKRLYSIERKADKSPDFALLYTTKFDDYILKGYLQPVQEQDEVKRWYLPHFFAYHPNKKPRLVFDAAAKASGYSFNSFFMTGPDLLQPLPKVLLRFRTHKIAIIGDIREMFHQVRLKKTDRRMQTILYRGMDRKSSPTAYEMTVLYFGSICSPSSANYVKDLSAKQFENDFPAAVKAIIHDTYMDDFLSGAETKEEAIRLQKGVIQIHCSGGFQIAKWNSSNTDVLNSIPKDLRATGEKVISVKSELPVERTLGVQWKPAEDIFTFTLNMDRLPTEVKMNRRYPTKREIASFIMSIFDPLGFLTPLKVKGLIIFQLTWRLGLGWDDEVTSDLNKKWQQWLSNLQQIEKVTIPRCVRESATRTSKYELHTFCDASEEAYAAVTYLRLLTESGINVSFLAGKGRVAPIKGLSIPRMELQAALLGCRLAQSVKDSFLDDLTFSKHFFWTDSRTVLCWLNSETGRFSQFVTNRIGEILEKTDVQDWKWISTKLNVADDATRLSSELSFSSDSRWLLGPTFLKESEDSWPVLDILNTDVKTGDLEVRKAILALSRNERELSLPDINCFSNWFSLIRKTAHRIASFRLFGRKSSTEVTLADVEKAEEMWAMQVQMDSFSSEREALKNGSVVDKKSRLFSLCPQMSKKGLIVLKGRIGKAHFVGQHVISPMVLDPAHRYTKLLMRWRHVTNAHQGQETVINELRKKYWILNCRGAVRSIISSCPECKLRRVQPIPALMRDLPEARLASYEPAFTHSATDLFGPIEVLIGRRCEKRWGVIFTCLTTRAVYFDLVPSLSTSDFIDCLIRFNARRGPTKHLWSDNGTNFKGADNEIKENVRAWNQAQVRDTLLAKGVEWHFIAPASPWMGGAYERLIGIAKKIIRNMLKERKIKEYTLLTTLAEVEQIMNSRPLTVASPNPDDLECITPNHLLKLRCIPEKFIPGEFKEGSGCRRLWRYAQTLADEFWKRWTEEYLPTLNKRQKWKKQEPNIREGDIVILLDDQAQRNQWKKGVVQKTFPGKDGIVRVVDVRVPILDDTKKVKQAVFRRHVMKLCPLDLNVKDWEKTMSFEREKCSGVKE